VAREPLVKAVHPDADPANPANQRRLHEIALILVKGIEEKDKKKKKLEASMNG